MLKERKVKEVIERKVDAVISPLQDFVRDETMASGFLFGATVVALILANSAFASAYFDILHAPLMVGFAGREVHFDLHHLVNDGLMTLFFLVLGLEIKRELLVGELRERRRALPVLAAALGGMLAPAGIYALCNAGKDTALGWGIPMATDSAFALGVLALLRDRVPAGLKAFLVAFAIIDDLGAILVIAVFYTVNLDVYFLFAGVLCMTVLLLCNVAGLRHINVYLLLGIVLWFCVVKAGIHGTVAGVLIAAAVPARPRHGQTWFIRTARQLTARVEQLHRRRRDRDILSDLDQHTAVEEVERVARSASTPLRRWERALERPVLILVLPLFALANAGIPISGNILAQAAVSPVTWGIVLGLFLGKALGISLMTWCALRLGGILPGDMDLGHLLGLALLGGMGFTMSIFISGLSFADPAHLDLAKLSVLIASVITGFSGYLWLRCYPRIVGSGA